MKGWIGSVGCVLGVAAIAGCHSEAAAEPESSSNDALTASAAATAIVGPTFRSEPTCGHALVLTASGAGTSETGRFAWTYTSCPGGSGFDWAEEGRYSIEGGSALGLGEAQLRLTSETSGGRPLTLHQTAPESMWVEPHLLVSGGLGWSYSLKEPNGVELFTFAESR